VTEVTDCNVGEEMYQLLVKLFPICRSITGNGFRQSLDIISEIVPITRYEVPTGTQVFDWTVPKEWNIRDAYIEDEQGQKIIDFKKQNLHVVGYSTPVDEWLTLEELEQHLHSLPEQPNAIPYVTSYYRERWGFCMAQEQRDQLRPGKYHAVIDSDLKDGSLTYGEVIIPGETKREIFLSTYLCHPSMANDNLSGPVVTAFLAKWLLELPKRKYTYRIVFVPETIGSITYLSRNIEEMKANVIAGFNISCVGDERIYSFLASRYGNTLADKVALHILNRKQVKFYSFSYLVRGSDERQYCSPGVDLPVIGIMRSKYGHYPEYHTSLDDLTLVTKVGLADSFYIFQDCMMALEHNEKYKSVCLCEPQMGKRGLYGNLSVKGNWDATRTMMDLIAYADGSNDLIDISNLLAVPVEYLFLLADKLEKEGILERT
jgi:aminopeptidase-like protein